jgi:predicted RND superfamily exporter protein
MKKREDWGPADEMANDFNIIGSIFVGLILIGLLIWFGSWLWSII